MLCEFNLNYINYIAQNSLTKHWGYIPEMYCDWQNQALLYNELVCQAIKMVFKSCLNNVDKK